MMQAVAIPITSTRSEITNASRMQNTWVLAGKTMDLLIASVRTNFTKGIKGAYFCFRLFNSLAYQASGRLGRCISKFF